MLHRKIEVVNKSDVGSLRPHNEDSTASDADIGFAVVADGMGGYLAGEAASAIAVSSVVSNLLGNLPKLRKSQTKDTMSGNNSLLRKAIEEANYKIHHTAHNEKDCKGMGTTMVAVLFSQSDNNHICVAHVGDSRLYMLRDNKLSQVTKDHSLIQEMIDKGVCATVEEALEFVSKTYITRALGISKTVDVETNIHKIKKEDIYLLCSDGLSDMVPDNDIHRTMVKHSNDLDQLASTLIDMANAAGGKDNISIVMIRIVHATNNSEDTDTTMRTGKDKKEKSSARAST